MWHGSAIIREKKGYANDWNSSGSRTAGTSCSERIFSSTLSLDMPDSAASVSIASVASPVGRNSCRGGSSSRIVTCGCVLHVVRQSQENMSGWTRICIGGVDEWVGVGLGTNKRTHHHKQGLGPGETQALARQIFEVDVRGRGFDRKTSHSGEDALKVGALER